MRTRRKLFDTCKPITRPRAANNRVERGRSLLLQHEGKSESDSSGSHGVSNPDCGKRSHGTGIYAVCFSPRIGGIAGCPGRLGGPEDGFVPERMKLVAGRYAASYFDGFGESAAHRPQHKGGNLALRSQRDAGRFSWKFSAAVELQSRLF